jgi:putative FmdB family regulatory protein
MPIYEYECKMCQKRFEKIQHINEPAPQCPDCGGEVRKCYSVPALMFKGSGFYITDYAKKTGSVASQTPVAKEGKKEVASPKKGGIVA